MVKKEHSHDWEIIQRVGGITFCICATAGCRRKVTVNHLHDLPGYGKKGRV